MKKLIPLIFVFLFSLSTAFGQTTATTKDGREVILNADGSWKEVTKKENKDNPAPSVISITKDSDAAELFFKLADQTVKNEFETTEDYFKRKQEVVEKMSVNLLISANSLKYDADRQTFSVAPGVDTTEEGYRLFVGFESSVEFKMPINEAREKKDKIKVVFTGYPTDVNKMIKYMDFKLTKVTVYNSTDGTIYANKTYLK